ncbi:Uncharacterised protein [Serratia plymuthica]|nr:Uncharacterised protein [Serratia plymuthica]
MRADDRRCVFWGGLSGHDFIIATAAICGLPAEATDGRPRVSLNVITTNALILKE